MKEFASIEDFVAYLEAIPAAIQAAAPIGLEHAAQFVERGAREALGHYQDGAGDIPGWPELSDKEVILRSEWGYTQDDPLLVTHDLKSHIHHSVDAGALKAAVGVPSAWVGEHDDPHGDPFTRYRDVGEVALEHEMGGRLPQRSFLGLTCARHGEEISHLMVDAAFEALCGEAPRQASASHDDVPF